MAFDGRTDVDVVSESHAGRGRTRERVPFRRVLVDVDQTEDLQRGNIYHRAIHNQAQTLSGLKSSSWMMASTSAESFVG